MVGTPFDKSFTRLLIEDVLDAYDHLRQRDSQSARRQVVRVIFAAIEGQIWLCREHVRDAAASMTQLSPIIGMALREQSYVITEAGDVKEQPRYVTLTASIRLAVRQANLLAPDLMVDFGGSGWTQLKQALATRHRITHPKRTADLVIEDCDLGTARGAFEWVLATVSEVLNAIVSAQSAHNQDMRLLLEKLKSGDPAALRAYQHALETMPDD
jgi:hypothetical protein